MKYQYPPCHASQLSGLRSILRKIVTERTIFVAFGAHCLHGEYIFMFDRMVRTSNIPSESVC